MGKLSVISTGVKRLISGGASNSVAKSAVKEQAKVYKTAAKQQTKQVKAENKAAVKVAKQQTKQTKLQTKSAALGSTSAGSAALSTKKITAGKVLNAIGGVGNLAITGLLGMSLVGELMNPQELPTNPDDPAQEFLDQQAQEGGFLEQAEDAAEEILDPLSDVPLIGDAVDAASENGLSLPLLILILVLIGAAVFAAVKLIKKGKKTARKKTRKPAKKGAAA